MSLLITLLGTKQVVDCDNIQPTLAQTLDVCPKLAAAPIKSDHLVS